MALLINGKIVGNGLLPFEPLKTDRELNSLIAQKELMIKGGYKGAEPNMVVEIKQEVIDTIAKKDYDKPSMIQNMGMGSPRSMLFKIKKGDPIQVIKTNQKGTIQNDIFYSLKKHNGQNFAMTTEEENKLAIKRQFGFMGNFGFFSDYNLPKDVVEEQTIVEKAKDIVSVNSNDTPETKNNKNLIKYGLIALVGYIVYRLVSKKEV
jgi:hypothetical protein